jgi:hypothetical protein
VPAFPVDRTIVAALKKRVQLAQKIDQEEHRLQKASKGALVKEVVTQRRLASTRRRLVD